jgi:radical SAM/Cys-rich protein
MKHSRPHGWSPRSEFDDVVDDKMPRAHRAAGLSVITVNCGLYCNLRCALCHLRCSPSRTERMERGVMLNTLTFAAEIHPDVIELTGGEPVLWSHLREFLQLASEVAPRVRVHTNLSSLLEPEGPLAIRSLVETRSEVLASLPEMLEDRTVGECMDALKLLSAAGYGDPANGDIPLDIVYTPMAGSAPRPLGELDSEYRQALAVHGIRVRNIIATAHVALGGFEDWLEESGQREAYRTAMREAFSPAALAELPCRHGLEIAWDGTMWDCDYHLAASRQLSEEPRDVGEYVGSPVGQMSLASRRIAFAEHCFACAARRES